jgi:hypothetical protein
MLIEQIEHILSDQSAPELTIFPGWLANLLKEAMASTYGIMLTPIHRDVSNYQEPMIEEINNLSRDTEVYEVYKAFIPVPVCSVRQTVFS